MPPFSTPSRASPLLPGRLRIAALAIAIIGAPLVQASAAGVLPSVSSVNAAELSTPSYVETRDRLLGTLPTDPIEAARALAGQILGPDEAVAQVATIELLRQAGVPVINLDGAIVAMPSDGVIGNGPMIGESLSGLTASVREGNFYTIAAAADIFVDSDASSEPIPPDLLLAGIVSWGKGDGDPRESIVAGTAVRELGRLRGQPLFPGLAPDATHVDLLQFTLLYLHLVGDSQQVDVAASGSGATAGLFGPAIARAADDCRALYDALQLKPMQGKSPGDKISNAIFKEAFWEAMSAANQEAASQVKNALKNVDYASKIANALVFLTSVKLSIEPDKRETHFKHAAGETSRDVRVVATASWQQGETMQEMQCLQGLVGIDTQPNGPMPGLRVKWRLEQEQTSSRSGKLMRAKQGQGQEFTPTGAGGEVTGADGTSDIVLEPATERQPGVGAEMSGNVTVYASLDKDQVPDALKAFLGNKTLLMDNLKGRSTKWGRFLFDQAFDISLKAIMRAGMPMMKENIKVGYHGADMYLISGARHPFALFYFTRMNIFAYTCEGLAGRWRGTMSIHADENWWGELAESLGSTSAPDAIDGDTDIDQYLDVTAEAGQLAIHGPWNLLVDVDRSAIDRGQHGVVGTAEMRVGTSPVDIILPFDPVATFDVLRLDKRNASDFSEFCPNNESYFP